MIPLKLNETDATHRRVPARMVDAATGLTGVTSLVATATVRIAKAAGAWAAASGTLIERGGLGAGRGSYVYEAAAGELDTVGLWEYEITEGTARTFVNYAYVLPADLYDAVRLGLTALPNAVAAAAGGLFTRGAGAGQINQAANGQIDVNVVALSDAGAAEIAIAVHGNQVVDNITRDGSNMMTGGRLRIFATGAAATAATAGGTFEGELVALAITAVGAGGLFTLQKAIGP